MAAVVLTASLTYESARLEFLCMALGPGLEYRGGCGASEDENGSEALHNDLRELKVLWENWSDYKFVCKILRDVGGTAVDRCEDGLICWYC
jgi:hypothetical protein